jgi:hypothetical protein
MKRDEYDLEGLPIVAKGPAPAGNYVAPAPLARREPITIDTPAWLVQPAPLQVANAWEPQNGAKEETSAMDRAQALRVRLLPFGLLWALLGIIVGIVVLVVAQNAPGAALCALLTFVAMTSTTYIKLNGQDYAHSREGTERHRITTAADLQREAMRNDQELRRLALETYLRSLEIHQR